MSESGKYNKKTIMALLKIMLAVRTDLSEAEKAEVLRLTEQILKEPLKDHEDKQRFYTQDYKRRN